MPVKLQIFPYTWINDVLLNITSKVELYTDDTLIHRVINATENAALYLNTLTQWAQTWLMNFNANKCVHLTITRKTSPLTTNYNCAIQQNNCAKYLGVTIVNKLSWSEHITTIQTLSELSCRETLINANLQSSQPAIQHIYVPF